MSKENLAAPVLVVDDEPDICELVAMTLARQGVATDTANNVQGAKEKIDHQKYALCLTDMRLPDGNGLQLIEYIQQVAPSLPVAMITAHGNIDTAIAALKAGAFDFLTKPIDIQQLRQLVSSAIRLEEIPTISQNSPLTNKLVGDSVIMQDLRAMVVKVARNQAPVFIHGESGTGKEVVARLIHEQSSRADAPFVAVNCGAIPSELMESEFFGHRKGSFTGAMQDKNGLFQEAHGGTLFLDEVADLPVAMQVKLLRAIQEKAVRPIGAGREEQVDIRLLSATHKDLPALVASEEFRSDLFYRINVIEMQLPSLRERREDIPSITSHLLARSANGQTPRGITEGALQELSRYHFPGNVRELENILERASALTDSAAIDTVDLQLRTDNTAQNTTAKPSQNPATQAIGSAIITPASDARAGQSLDEYLQAIEKNEIETAIEAARWNKTDAAKRLGISFRSLRYRLKKLGLED